MEYSTIQPPFTLNFREMSKRELREYARWFHDVLPTRIAGLAKAVKSTPGYEDWEPDATPESLEQLGHWFEGQVETRAKTAEELARAKADLPYPIDIPEVELTNRTFSLAMDIGMYFARVVIHNNEGAEWDQPLRGSKRFVDYGQPVVVGLGPVPLNPVQIMVTNAYRVSWGEPSRLRELYDTWVRMKRA